MCCNAVSCASDSVSEAEYQNVPALLFFFWLFVEMLIWAPQVSIEKAKDGWMRGEGKVCENERL